MSSILQKEYSLKMKLAAGINFDASGIAQSINAMQMSMDIIKHGMKHLRLMKIIQKVGIQLNLK